MKRRSFRLVLFLLAAAVAPLVAGCSLFGSSGPKAFPWIQDGHQMTYDFQAGPEPLVDPNTGFVYDSAENVSRILIQELDYADFQFKTKSVPDNGWIENHGRVGEINMIIAGLFGFPGPKRAEDGIRVEYAADCDGGEGFDSAVRVPADPEVGQRYRLYECGDRVSDTYEITAVGETVTVPAGTFEGVFVMHNRADRQKDYWSETEGLLKVERYGEEDGRLLGAYVLASKNF